VRIPINSKPHETPNSVGDESEVWSAIAAFERILEATPNDRAALETLHDAYQRIGQTSKAIEYLIRLAQTILDENDTDAAPGVLRRLQALGQEDETLNDIVEQLTDLVGEIPDPGGPQETAPRESRRKTIDITSELSLAWSLLQAEELTQDQYSSVVHDLSESSTRAADTPVSVLHVLHGRGFSQIDKIIAFLSNDTSTPVLSLKNFEIPQEAHTLLPLEFMATRGAIVFELMGDDALVAILNPYDTELREQVERLTARKCHYYLVHPGDYDNTLHDIRKTLLSASEE